MSDQNHLINSAREHRKPPIYTKSTIGVSEFKVGLSACNTPNNDNKDMQENLFKFIGDEKLNTQESEGLFASPNPMSKRESASTNSF